MIPVYSFLEGDTMGLLILVYENETVADLAKKIQLSARLRVKEYEEVDVLFNGNVMSPQLLVTEYGIQPLDRIDVRKAGEKNFV